MERKEYAALVESSLSMNKEVVELLCTNGKEYAFDHSVIEMSDINVKKVSDEKYAPIVPINAPVTLEWSSLNVAINVSLITYTYSTISLLLSLLLSLLEWEGK